MLVRGHDLGTSLMFFGLFVVLLYVTTERVSWVIIGLLLFAGGAYLAYQLFGNVQTRVDVWLHLFNATAQRRRLPAAPVAVRARHRRGVRHRPRQGHPELVPLPTTDFIISSFGEEIGLFGLVGLLVLYALFVGRGLAAAIAVRDAFGKLLAMGLSFLIAIQLFVVVAGVTRLLPETGLTAPFLSYGGSSLVGSCVCSRCWCGSPTPARRPATTPPARPAHEPVAVARA